MKITFSIALLLLLNVHLFGQSPELIIEEDYTNPKSFMVYKSKFSAEENPVKDGLYSPEPEKKFATSISFPEELKEQQKRLNEISDMEFFIVKLKGNDERDFTIIRIRPERSPIDDYDLEMNFKFNQLGTFWLEMWQTKGGVTSIGNGKAKVNKGRIPNIIRIEHRKDTLRYFINNEMVFSYQFEVSKRINWNNCSIIYEKDSKQRIALDKVAFKGYLTPKDISERQSEIKKQREKEETDKYASIGLPVQIKSKTHNLYAYAGWSDIFSNSEKYSDLRSDYGDKKPSEVFNEAPGGWIKESILRLYSLNLQFFDTDSSTLEKEKEEFINLAQNRTGWKKEKIKPLEERMILPDGRKGLLLFYVCPDTKGMVGGYYFNCDLYIESNTKKNNIICYRMFIEGGNPELPQNIAWSWKDYFKKVLLTVRPN